MLEINKIYNIDCLEGMKQIDDGSIDMILCDLPYGTTQNKWDVIIPFKPLWEQYERIIKDNGAIILTASQPFTSMLVTSNLKLFKYDFVWNKTQITGFLNAKKMPLRQHEDVLVFYKKLPIYNPQFAEGKPYKIKREHATNNYGTQKHNETKNDGRRYPTSVINIPQVREKDGHPTQKPIALFEYLIKTYTNEGALVLDPCIGAGTTALACLNTNRNYIGMDNGICEKKNSKYYGWYWADVARDRINNHEHRKV
jgi:site-specific DNA-methyltransferase (adenine-specific)